MVCPGQRLRQWPEPWRAGRPWRGRYSAQLPARTMRRRGVCRGESLGEVADSGVGSSGTARSQPAALVEVRAADAVARMARRRTKSTTDSWTMACGFASAEAQREIVAIETSNSSARFRCNSPSTESAPRTMLANPSRSPLFQVWQAVSSSAAPVLAVIDVSLSPGHAGVDGPCVARAYADPKRKSDAVMVARKHLKNNG